LKTLRWLRVSRIWLSCSRKNTGSS
jgi:hypothetical protein